MDTINCEMKDCNNTIYDRSAYCLVHTIQVIKENKDMYCNDDYEFTLKDLKKELAAAS